MYARPHFGTMLRQVNVLTNATRNARTSSYRLGRSRFAASEDCCLLGPTNLLGFVSHLQNIRKICIIARRLPPDLNYGLEHNPLYCRRRNTALGT